MFLQLSPIALYKNNLKKKHFEWILFTFLLIFYTFFYIFSSFVFCLLEIF